MGLFKGLEEILEDNLKAIENTSTRSDGDMLVSQTLNVMASMLKELKYKVDKLADDNK